MLRQYGFLIGLLWTQTRCGKPTTRQRLGIPSRAKLGWLYTIERRTDPSENSALANLCWLVSIPNAEDHRKSASDRFGSLPDLRTNEG